MTTTSSIRVESNPLNEVTLQVTVVLVLVQELGIIRQANAANCSEKSIVVALIYILIYVYNIYNMSVITEVKTSFFLTFQLHN